MDSNLVHSDLFDIPYSVYPETAFVTRTWTADVMATMLKSAIIMGESMPSNL